MKGIFFFSAEIFFARPFLTRNLFPSKLVCEKIFSEITHTPLPPQKSNGRPITENKLPEHGFENSVFSVFKNPLIIHREKTKEINIERCARSGPKKPTKTYYKKGRFPNHSTLINFGVSLYLIKTGLNFTSNFLEQNNPNLNISARMS